MHQIRNDLVENSGHRANVGLDMRSDAVNILGISNRELELALSILMPVDRRS
ncbi:hypothetical protein Hsar01_01813 [Haloferula sargassicola]|uniref:Uncharacterized protein n=1 Tax=Haloferula sargassicola TaxID=490096 RepID=A0ABP9UMW7_9BACT